MLLLLLIFNLFQPELQVEFSNIKQASGQLYIAVYDREDAFLNTDQIRCKKIVPLSRTGVIRISLGNLPAGKYAVSCFHDQNGNGKLDTNWMGIPSEPYGFSNDARPKFRAPRWAEAVFELGGAGKLVPVKLEKW